jgi:hypothetical protein
VLVVDVVPVELESGRTRGREAFDRLTGLVNTGAIEIVGLTDDTAHCFEDLAVGTAAATLDGGEAPTIAYALAHAGTTLIDQLKATRICAQRFRSCRWPARSMCSFIPRERRRRIGLLERFRIGRSTIAAVAGVGRAFVGREKPKGESDEGADLLEGARTSGA